MNLKVLLWLLMPPARMCVQVQLADGTWVPAQQQQPVAANTAPTTTTANTVVSLIRHPFIKFPLVPATEQYARHAEGKGIQTNAAHANG